MRDHDRHRLLRHLEEQGPTSRTDLVDVTGLSRGGLRSLLEELLAEGTIADQVPDSTDRPVGRPARLIALVPRSESVLAVHVRAEEVRVAVVGTDGAISTVRDRACITTGDRDATLEVVSQLLQEALGPRARPPSHAVLALPTMVDEWNQVVDPAGAAALMASWAEPGTASAASAALGGRPVRLLNDGQAALLAERRLCAARGVSNALRVAVGHTGIAGGVLLGGQTFTGSHGRAGEISHLSVARDGVICPCGQRGCLAAEVRHQIRQLLATRPGWHAVADLAAAAAGGDRAAGRLFTDIGTEVGRVLGGLANVLDPDVVVISDELSLPEDDTLRCALRTAFDQHVHPGIGPSVTVADSPLGVDATLAGCGLSGPRSAPV